MTGQAQSLPDELVTVEDHAGILLLRLNVPPANALTARLRAVLSQILTRIAGDPKLGAVVLIGRKDVFLRGLEYAELGQVQAKPGLADLCNQIEAMPVPVICALSGAVQGAGLELALAAHHRIAQSETILAFPDIRLGLAPTGGATQRMPRLAGAATAISLLCEGQFLAADQALAVGLLDQVTARGLEARALSWAHDLRRREFAADAACSPGMVRTRDRREGLADPGGFFRAVETARGRFLDPRQSHSGLVLDAIEAAALLGFDQGLEFEAIRSRELAESMATKARLHGFACERAVLAPPRLLSGQKTGPISQLLVRGENPVLAGPIRLALAAGMRVNLMSDNQNSANQLRGIVESLVKSEIAQSRLAAAAGEADMERLALRRTTDRDGSEVLLSDGSAGADSDVPVVLLGGLRPSGPEEVVLWPASSAGKVVDICAGSGTSLQSQAAAYSLARSMGFQVHLQGPGLPISQRLRRCLRQTFDHLHARGHQVQHVAQSLGAMGIGIAPEMKLPALPPGGAEIQAKALAALANEGMRCLADGAAARPRDVDAAALFHGILPAWCGGPLFQADQVGVMAMRLRLRSWAADAPDLFAPAALWDQLVTEGRSLADLNRDGISQAPVR